MPTLGSGRNFADHHGDGYDDPGYDEPFPRPPSSGRNFADSRGPPAQSNFSHFDDGRGYGDGYDDVGGIPPDVGPPPGSGANFSHFAGEDPDPAPGPRRGYYGHAVEMIPATNYYGNTLDPLAPRSVPRTGMDCVEHPDLVQSLLHPQLEHDFHMGAALPPMRAERLEISHGGVPLPSQLSGLMSSPYLSPPGAWLPAPTSPNPYDAYYSAGYPAAPHLAGCTIPWTCAGVHHCR